MSALLNFLMLVVFIIIIAIASLAVTNRIIFKMAFRNFSRRKAQSVIVIAGLMIGTAIVSSALVVRDTMVNTFEIDVYRSLGEVDEEVWGTETWTSVTYFRYFNESIYDSLNRDLSSVAGIESIAPVISDNCAVFDNETKLGEPSAALIGLDSQIMRSSSFGDLDGSGFYTDSLSVDEVAINSRLANEMDASEGDEINVSYGAKDPNNPQGTSISIKKFTVRKIIEERDLYGKGNYNQRKTLFFELDTLQELLNRPNEINKILISNDGDYRGGESRTGKVNGSIKEVLDDAVGMSDLGLELEVLGDSLHLTSNNNFYPIHHADHLVELSNDPTTTTTKGVMVSTVSLNNSFNNLPTNGSMVMGVASDDPAMPTMIENSIYFLKDPFNTFAISNGTDVTITSINMEGSLLTSRLQAYQVPAEFEASLPDEVRTLTIGIVNFDTGQQLLHRGTYGEDMVTFVKVSGLDGSILETTRQDVISKMDADFGGSDINLEVHDVKADNLEAARAGGESLGTLFMIFGMFAIIAGVVLIINIFVMLGEERKSEMGMARAVGMKGKHLVRMYIFEGSLYAFVASIVGALLGLFFGYIIILAFSMIFGDMGELAGESFNIPFFFTWSSVFIAFSIGLLITFATIIFASTRITKLNIIRAIRRIPEPTPERAKKKVLVAGIIMIIFGLFITSRSFATSDGGYYLAGLPSMIIGSALITHKWASMRLVMTSAGLLILFFMFSPIEFSFQKDWDFSGLTSFVFSGVFSVLGAIMVVMFNSKYLLGFLQNTFGRARSTRAVLKTAISYPMDNKFKTAMTLGMFSLIIFTVTVIAMIAAMQGAQADTMLIQQSGGYDVMGITNPRTPFVNLTKAGLPPELEDSIDEFEIISQTTVSLIDYDELEIDAPSYGGPPLDDDKLQYYKLLGAGKGFSENNDFTLLEWDEDRFETERDVWEGLQENSSVCVVDGTKLAYSGIQMGGPPVDMGGVYIGGTITITDMAGQNRTRELIVIGIMDQLFFFNGIIVKKDIVDNEYNGADTMFVAKLHAGESADATAKAFEKNYLSLGLQTFDLKGVINMILEMSSNIMYLMEGFLGIGLLVGIAGIGIISYRNVIERRQQIGMLRAIGFKRSMVTKSFLIETSFITILAIVIGLILGIGIGWQIYKDGFADQGGSFVVPWLNLLTISATAYIATLIFTISPSIKASKIPPAEALRYIE